VEIVVNGYKVPLDSKFLIESSGSVCFDQKQRSDRLTSDELQRMNLQVDNSFLSSHYPELMI
jgi:hypothetical protein